MSSLEKSGVSYAGCCELIYSARQGEGRGEFSWLRTLTDTQCDGHSELRVG